MTRLGLFGEDDVASHEAAADPHTVYQKESEKDTVNGYAGLDANGVLKPTLFDDTVHAMRGPGLHADSHAKVHGNADHTNKLVSKTYLFLTVGESLVLNEDFNGKAPVQVPAAAEHGALTPKRLRVSARVAGTGTNTIVLQTSATLTGARTDRATVALGAAQEASATAFGGWTPADNEYLWVRATAVGATPPKDVRAQLDVTEELF